MASPFSPGSVGASGTGQNTIRAGAIGSPQLGMAHRFTVKIGTRNLGNWAKASGLKVSWKPLEHRPGDVVNGVWWYPGTTSYEPIKLSRAADKTNSQTTWTWLKSVSSKNMPDTGHIALYDAGNAEVFHWDLDGVFPISWDIEAFDASASKVAIETLTLQHNGFLFDEQPIRFGAVGSMPGPRR
jgi:phage tail-like protein